MRETGLYSSDIDINPIEILARQAAGFFSFGEKVMTPTERDRDVLARTLWGEARGETLAGQNRRGLDHPQPRERRQS